MRFFSMVAFLVLAVLGRTSESRADTITDYFSGVGTYTYEVDSQPAIIIGNVSFNYDNTSTPIQLFNDSQYVAVSYYDMSNNCLGTFMPFFVILAPGWPDPYYGSINNATNYQVGVQGSLLTYMTDLINWSVSRTNNTGSWCALSR